MQEKTPMACRKFVCMSLLTHVCNMQEKTPMACRKFVYICLVIMILGDLDKQGDVSNI